MLAYCGSPLIKVMCIYAQKGMFKAMPAIEITQRTQVVFEAFSTLPEHPSDLITVTAMAASVDMLQT